jgi:hypothetical protein
MPTTSLLLLLLGLAAATLATTQGPSTFHTSIISNSNATVKRSTSTYLTTVTPPRSVVSTTTYHTTKLPTPTMPRGKTTITTVLTASSSKVPYDGIVKTVQTGHVNVSTGEAMAGGILIDPTATR